MERIPKGAAVKGESGNIRRRLEIRGQVQGVGFRPYVYRLAKERGLGGWIRNDPAGVVAEVEGRGEAVESFISRLRREKPPLAEIDEIRISEMSVADEGLEFSIEGSSRSENISTGILPDVSMCPDCLADIVNPENRRYRYPFTNCTNCGPRYSIIESLPYDRQNTSMRIFDMCPECREEYKNPVDRRFHAQPNACPECGPLLELWDRAGNCLSQYDMALLMTADAIREGKVAAVKGLGGFHLICDARNEQSVETLRSRKHREEKPLALMFPSIGEIELECEVSEVERNLLLSPRSPIVILKKKPRDGKVGLAIGVAPGNPYLGVMLPYTPLHYLLLKELGFPVVATSGNISDEPVCIDENEAVKRLGGIADLFLVHNRPIVRYVDDSVVKFIDGKPVLLRSGRGYAPSMLNLKSDGQTLLAVGAHQKNTVSMLAGEKAITSRHIGDLNNNSACEAFEETIEQIESIYNRAPEILICDKHPDYYCSRYARERSYCTYPVQHHYAHVLSCMIDNGAGPPALGVVWDGTGYGDDGTIWGGEFLYVGGKGYKRIASFKPFRLPGGDKAIWEPWRTALGVLFELYGTELAAMDVLPALKHLSENEKRTLLSMLSRGINSPLTSSAGRLFDAAASLTGIRQKCSYEGQSAMEMEYLTEGVETDDYYNYVIGEGKSELLQIDWAGIVEGLIEDVNDSLPKGDISAKFHNTLSRIILDVCRSVGETKVALTGGCFQNKYLSERTAGMLRAGGFDVYTHSNIPPNDGGISLGQTAAYLKDENGGW
ncbi:MAG: carbamoyltransferase HypF [candidate division Zixibacteria bacterium]|nr:carbamoyltransferase HypF [candidate division Zixibacteria bacterium]